jgi:hypothetical protein
VVLPAPLRPTSPTISPLSTVKESLSTAILSPKRWYSSEISSICQIGIKLIDWRIVHRLLTEGNRLRRTGSDLFPIVGVVVSAVLIVIGRTQRNNPVAIAGYVVLALSAGLYLYLRSR